MTSLSKDLAINMSTATPNGDQDGAMVYISEAVEIICATYSDTFYIPMAMENVHDPIIQCNVSIISSTCEMNNTNKVLLSEIKDTKVSEFMKLQQEELLGTLCTFQSYLQGV